MSYNFPSLYSSESRISDKGVFSSVFVKKGTVLYSSSDSLNGYVQLRFKEIDQLEEEEKQVYLRYAVQIDTDLWSGPLKVDSNINDISLYWNHSCEPNTYFQANNVIVALRDIEAGEELTYDYCTTDTFEFPLTYVKYMPYLEKCNCGASKCRGKISPNDWKRKDLQEKYKGQFSPYIQAK